MAELGRSRGAAGGETEQVSKLQLPRAQASQAPLPPSALPPSQGRITVEPAYTCAVTSVLSHFFPQRSL